MSGRARASSALAAVGLLAAVFVGPPGAALAAIGLAVLALGPAGGRPRDRGATAPVDTGP